MSITPPSRPRLTRPELEERIRAAHPGRELPAFCIAVIPGYYLNSMGKPGVNDRCEYDDALFIVSPDAFAGFNANTDPSVYRQNIATLQPGWWDCYQFDIHGGSKPHPAICQRKGPVIVRRDGTENVAKGTKDDRGTCLGGGMWIGMFGINNHMGGVNGTHSLGCLTVPPPQWPGYYELARTEAMRVFGDDWNKATITIIVLP
jgi:hypothetical protein